MAEVELVPYKDFLICPTPVRTETVPGSKQYCWRDGYYVYTAEKDVKKNRPGTCCFDTKTQARESALSSGKALIDAGL